MTRVTDAGSGAGIHVGHPGRRPSGALSPRPSVASALRACSACAIRQSCRIVRVQKSPPATFVNLRLLRDKGGVAGSTHHPNHLKTKHLLFTRFKSGAWMRHDDLMDEYPRVKRRCFVFKWFEWQGLNLRPRPCEGRALPLSYTRTLQDRTHFFVDPAHKIKPRNVVSFRARNSSLNRAIGWGVLDEPTSK